MTALITTAGKVRILQLMSTDMTHIGFGAPNPAWVDQFNPPSETVDQTALVSIVGYAKISARGWLQQDDAGLIVIDSVKYSKVTGPTTIAYVEGIIPSGQAEGTANKIGQIGVFGQNVVTNPSNATWVTTSGVTTPGTLFRIMHVPAYIKQPNSTITYLVAFPLQT